MKGIYELLFSNTRCSKQIFRQLIQTKSKNDLIERVFSERFNNYSR